MPLKTEHRRVIRWMNAAVIAALLVPTALFAVASWIAYQRAFDDARNKVDRVSRVIQEHGERVMETAAAVIGLVDQALLGLDDREIRAREPELRARLRRISELANHVQGVYVVGADSTTLLNDRLDRPVRRASGADREYFQFHQQNPQGGMHIGGVIIGRETGAQIFTVSRRRSAPDGEFGGVIAVALHPSRLGEFYARIARDEPGMVVSLVSGDGNFLGRHPPAPNDQWKMPASSPLLPLYSSGRTEGFQLTRSPVDGKLRLGAFRKLEGLPLYANAGVNHDMILQGWYRTVALLALFTFPTAFGLAYVSWVARRRAQREYEMFLRLRDEMTARAKAEETLRQTQKLEALGRLTGGVAHDFNNLLTIVSNNAFLIERLAPEGEPLRGPVASIRRAVASGEKLTRQLLSIAGRQPLYPQVIRLQNRLPAIADLLATAVGARVQLQHAVEPDTRPIEVDASELELALLNLAINARDAMPDGGTLSVRARNAGCEHVAIDVIDSGTGIAPEHLARVLEPFFSTKPPGKGTGLGLAQVQSLCAQAGGRVEVQSTLGRGTCVSLLFPPASGEEAAPEAHGGAPARLQGLRVLLVEDNADVANATRAMLEVLGAAVEVVDAAEAALPRLVSGAHAVDVVVTDVIMPGAMSGIDLARELARRQAPVPVVLVTGYSEQLASAAEVGAIVIAKPCTAAALANAIRRARARLSAPAGGLAGDPAAADAGTAARSD